MVVIPIGVLGNIAFSLLTTERSLLASLHQFPRHYLLLAVLLGLVPWFTNALRLLLWTDLLDHRLRFREAFQITLSVDLGAAITPTAVGGGFLKWAMLVQRGISPGAAATITSLPSVEDGLFFLVAVPAALYLTSSWDLPVFRGLAARVPEHVVPVVVGAVAVIGGVALLLRLVLGGTLGGRVQRRSVNLIARARRRLRTAWQDAREVMGVIVRRGKTRFAISMVLTAIQWIARYSVVSALVAFLGAPVDPVLFWLFQWVVFTLMTLIPTPGAVGGAEAAFFLIYSAFLPEQIIGLATAGWRFLTFYLQLGLAALLFSMLGLERPFPGGTGGDAPGKTPATPL